MKGTYIGIEGLLREKAERLDRSVAEPWTSLTAANKFFFTAAMLLKIYLSKLNLFHILYYIISVKRNVMTDIWKTYPSLVRFLRMLGLGEALGFAGDCCPG